MTKNRAVILGLVALLLAIIIVGATALQATAGESSGGWVENENGYTITVKCHSGKVHTLTAGHNSQVVDCSDVDQFRVNRDERCAHYYSLESGMVLVRINPGHFFKLPNYQTITVFADNPGRCPGAPWMSVYLERV